MPSPLAVAPRCCAVTHALVRPPAHSAVDGLRAEDRGAPDLDRFRADHAAYAAALRDAGVSVTELPPLEAFPDAQFVEDPALCLPEGAVILRPGAPSRLGEAEAIAPAVSQLYGGFDREVRRIARGAIEGGDILMCEDELLVGASARTDADGVAALAEIVADWGWPVRRLATPPDVLHFKTDCALLDAETLLVTPRLAAAGGLARYRLIETAEGEEAGANAVRVNAVVLAPDGFPRTAETLDRAGYDLRLLPNGEAAKLDGGMSCLSLRCAPRPADR